MSDRLLQHYMKTLKDRQIYWAARERAKTVGDVLVLIIDSYDRAKVVLPRFPFQRTPKKAIYDQIRSALTAHSFGKNKNHDFGLNGISCMFPLFGSLMFPLIPPLKAEERKWF